jgi:hypothetical protein
MYYELSKREKKIARACIDKGLNEEYKASLEKAKKIITGWETGEIDNRDAYGELYESVNKHDKHISRRYDSLRGSHYLVTVAAILHDGYIGQDDIKEFSDETKAILSRFVDGFKEDGDR